MGRCWRSSGAWIPVAPRTSTRARRIAGFTLLEMMIVVAILATLAAMAIPSYRAAVLTARYEMGMREMNLLQNEIDVYEMKFGALPLTLAELDHGAMLDPWGNPYQYLNFTTIVGKGVGAKRKDRFLVPLNSTYDLSSMGPDGQSKPTLTAAASRDDIIRANDGDYIGLAADY